MAHWGGKDCLYCLECFMLFYAESEIQYNTSCLLAACYGQGPYREKTREESVNFLIQVLNQSQFGNVSKPLLVLLGQCASFSLKIYDCLIILL